MTLLVVVDAESASNAYERRLGLYGLILVGVFFLHGIPIVNTDALLLNGNSSCYLTVINYNLRY